MFLYGSIINFFEPEVKMSGLLAIWDILSHVFLYWLGTMGIIVISILVLMSISMSYDTLSWAWRRQSGAAATLEAAAAAVVADVSASSGEAVAAAEAAAGTTAGAASRAAAGAERGKGAKWKKSSQRAKERREREARSGRVTPPFPLLFTKRPRARAPDKDDPEAVYEAAFSASLKHLANSVVDAEPNEDTSDPGGGGVEEEVPPAGTRATDCADTDTETLRSRSANSSSSCGGSSARGAAVEGEGRAPAGAEVAPDAPAAGEQRAVHDLPADTAAADRDPESKAQLPSPEVEAPQNASEKSATSSDSQNMQVALLPNTKRNCYTRSLSDVSFHAASHGDIRRLLTSYSSLLDDERWDKMGLVSVSKSRLMKSSLLPNFRYFSALTKNNAMITSCLAAMNKLKHNIPGQKFNSIPGLKKQEILKSLHSEFPRDTTRETNDGDNKTSQCVTMHEESSTELLKKKLQTWSCVPPAELRSTTQSSVLSTLTEVSEMGSVNDLKPFEVKLRGTGSIASTKSPKASTTAGNRVTSANQGRSNTRPKSANNPSKPNGPSKLSTINPVKPNSPPKSPPGSAKRPPSTNTPAKGGKVQSNISGTAWNFLRNPTPKIPTAKASNSKSTGGSTQILKPGTPQGSPTRIPPSRGFQGRNRR